MKIIIGNLIIFSVSQAIARSNQTFLFYDVLISLRRWEV